MNTMEGCVKCSCKHLTTVSVISRLDSECNDLVEALLDSSEMNAVLLQFWYVSRIASINCAKLQNLRMLCL